MAANDRFGKKPREEPTPSVDLSSKTPFNLISSERINRAYMYLFRRRTLIDLLQNPKKWQAFPHLYVRRIEPVTSKYVQATLLHEDGNLFLCFTLRDRRVTAEQVVHEGWELDKHRHKRAA